MESPYLKKMDEEEKAISEKEDAEIKKVEDTDCRNGRNCALVCCVGLGVIMGLSLLADYSDRGLEVFEGSVILGSGCCLSLAGMLGFCVGRSGDSEKLAQANRLRKIDRLEKKMREIRNTITNNANSLANKEINELEDAYTYFSNRVFEYRRSSISAQIHVHNV